MNLRDLKYLVAYLLPIGTYFSIIQAGIASFYPLIFAFIILPLLEFVLPLRPENLTKAEVQTKDHQIFFDLLLYLNIPILALLLYTFFTRMPLFESWIDWTGNTASLGLILSSSGINVAHELGHKKSKLARIAAKTLLIPSHYMHFIIEHNLGHHLNVSTPEDPATSRKGETVYFFWIRSTFQSYFNAWKIENKIQRNKNKAILNINNRMIHFAIIQFLYLATIFYFFGSLGFLAAIILGIISFLVLETINYIEHYGLVRKKKANGRYEVVTHKHSWNSDHQLGRILLYELTRHSDHHYKSMKKYQLLDSHEDSPELPFGYPGSIVISLFPPIWFKIMNKRVEFWSAT